MAATHGHPLPRSRERDGERVLLALVVAWATWLRLGLITAGPDPDVDGYAHFQIARRLAAEWRDLKIHWVWLPLWHLVDLACDALGGGFVAVRLVSVACAAASSFALASLLRRHFEENPATRPWLAEAERVIPCAAGVVHALWPQNLSAGSSAEPEAMFQLLALALMLAWQRRRWNLAAASLTAMVLLRYEAWPLLPVMLAMSAYERRLREAARVWLAPGVAVALWVALHRWNTGEWMWFLRENRAYVADAWREFALATRPLPKVAHPWLWYPYTVPFLSARAWLWIAAPGVPWLVLRAPRALVIPSMSLLAVVIVVWVTRRNLGLERHFTVLIPLYATAFAAGVAAPVSALAWTLTRRRAELTRLAVVLATLWVCFSFGKARTRKRAMLLRGHAEAAFVSERAVARTLRERARDGSPVFTETAVIEVLTGFEGRRFFRWKPRDVHDGHLRREAARHGEAWVEGPPSELTQLHGAEVVYRDATRALLRVQ
ncbi:MAG: hypothetical protein U0326_23055 [Polyangiales bacterium]